MSRISLLLVVLSVVNIAVSQVSFTGNAFNDFSLGAISTVAAKSLLHINESQSLTVTPSSFMQLKGWRSGIDILNVYMQYDYTVDTLYVGIDCDGICGDVDGDGNPSKSSDPNASDRPDMCQPEQISLMMWPEPPVAWQPNTDDFTYFFPTMVIGDAAATCLPAANGFGAYEFNGYKNCPWPAPINGSFPDACALQQNKVIDPSSGGYGADLPTLYPAGGPNKQVLKPILFGNPNASFPDIEFKMLNFSNYPGFTFKKDGSEPIKFGFSLYSASTVDSVGEDRVFPNFFSIPCPVTDACGVCGGNNSTCWDCAKVPNGPARYDACGVCAGNNQTCWDCLRVPNGPARYDACGVCAGNNHTCWDCARVPNGPARYDACGVCAGNNQTCWDCARVPNGPARYDACGVCAGNNQTCWDCLRVPNGPARYDACGVCAGNNQTCWDCARVPHGSGKYDACGVCGGNNQTCWDCAHVPNGPNRLDACGVCAGDNSTCWDCLYVPNGPNRYDACGVCAGDNHTCWDCSQTPNGNLTVDRFGVCGGDGLAGCDDVPHSKTVYDFCGVCGGDNSTCTCLEYLGCSLCEVDYALLRWSLGASLIKVNDTLDILYAIKHELPYYDYTGQALDLVDFIDTLHGFADNCLDHFDFAQYWFADFLAGHCNEDGTDCETLQLGGYRTRWDYSSHSRQKGGNEL